MFVEAMIAETLELAKCYVAAQLALSRIAELANDMPELQKEAREAAESLLWVLKEN